MSSCRQTDTIHGWCADEAPSTGLEATSTRRSSRCAATSTSQVGQPIRLRRREAPALRRSMRWALRSAKRCPRTPSAHRAATDALCGASNLVQYTEDAIDAAVAPLRADRNNRATRFAYRRAEPAALHRRCARLRSARASTMRWATCPARYALPYGLPLTQYTESRDQRGRGDAASINPSNQRAVPHSRRGGSGPLQRGQRVSAEALSPAIR